MIAAALLGLALSAAPADGAQSLPLPPPLKAEDTRPIVLKGGPEVKFIATETYSGLLYGLRGSRYWSGGPFYAGLMTYGDIPLVGRELAPAFGYMGLLAGYEGRLPYGLGYDVNMLGALTRAITDQITPSLRNQLSMEPSISLTLPVPWVKGTRVALCAGYFLAPLAPELSGPTFGLHVDFKTLEYRFALDD